jgi:hypothetical protein
MGFKHGTWNFSNDQNKPSYIDATRPDEKRSSKQTLSGKWRGYTPPPTVLECTAYPVFLTKAF